MRVFMPSKTSVLFRDIQFEMANDPQKSILFLFGVRKSGSSIMNSMVTSLARMNQFEYVDVAGRMFGSGVSVASWQDDASMADLLHGGNVYGGFRNAPLGLVGVPALTEAPQVLLVRDPRDALVSEYFSNAYSHSLPETGEAREQLLAERARAQSAEIGPYVMRMAPRLRRTLREYIPFFSHPRLRLYQYETAILDKRWFLRDVAAHFGWKVTDDQLNLILQWADVLPDAEQPTAFIRKVTPGDHREKLSPTIIEELNGVFADEMHLFGYKT
jgi:hypothetical protein